MSDPIARAYARLMQHVNTLDTLHRSFVFALRSHTDDKFEELRRTGDLLCLASIVIGILREAARAYGDSFSDIERIAEADSPELLKAVRDLRSELDWENKQSFLHIHLKPVRDSVAFHVGDDDVSNGLKDNAEQVQDLVYWKVYANDFQAVRYTALDARVGRLIYPFEESES
ncbi:MAG: hypothetical protein ACIAQU_10015, partial [Phycisphaerales bacterium JB064]